MLMVIHNLPKHMRFYDVKNLIQDKCGLNEVILDNLVSEGNNLRVTVGLADESDAALLVRKINGLYVDGSQLFVEDVRQKKVVEQPYQPKSNPHGPKQKPEKQMKYDQPMPMGSMPMGPMPMGPMPMGSMPMESMQMTPMPMDSMPMGSMPMGSMPMGSMPMGSMPMGAMPMAYSNLPFYMSPVQSSQANYENPAMQMQNKPPEQANYYQNQYQQPDLGNQWKVQPPYPELRRPAAEPSPNVSDNRNRNEPQWGERLGSRRSPTRAEESQWRGHDNRSNHEDSSTRTEQTYRRSPDRDCERFGNRNSQFNNSRRNESDGKSRFDRRDRSPPRKRDDGNREFSRNDELARQRSSRSDRSPPRDRNFDSRKREERRPNLDDRGRDNSYNDKHRAYDNRQRDHDKRHGSDRTEKPQDKNTDYNKQGGDQEYDKRQGRKRPYSDISESGSRTYANNPDNSTFSVSNANIFDKHPNVQKSDRIRSKEHDVDRRDFDRSASFKRSLPPNKDNIERDEKVSVPVPTKPEPPLRNLVQRHNNWRFEIAAALAREIISKVHPGHVPQYNYLLKKLKECIVARIDVRLGDTIVSSSRAMKEAYRSKFPPEDDQSLFDAVMEKMKRDQQETASDNLKGVPDSQIPVQNRPPNPRFQARTPNAASGFQARTPTATTRFQNVPTNPNPYYQNMGGTCGPRFQNRAPNNQTTSQDRKKTLLASPQGNYKVPNQPPRAKPPKPAEQNKPPTSRVDAKKAKAMQIMTAMAKNNNRLNKKDVSKVKILHKLEYSEEVDYETDPLVTQAIEDEVKGLVELYKTRPDNFTKKEDQHIFHRLVKDTTHVFKKVITLNLKKRILNITTGLVLRVFPAGKQWPNHAQFEKFMSERGVANVKKCPKMYVLACRDFDSYDALVEMETCTVGDAKMLIKTMHMAGPRQSVREKQRKGKRKNVETEFAEENFDDDLIHDDNHDDGDMDFTNDEFGADFMDEAGTMGKGVDIDEAGNINEAEDREVVDDVLLVEQKKEVVLVEDDDAACREDKTCAAGATTTENVGDSEYEAQLTEDNSQQSEILDHNIADDDLEDF